MILCPCTHTRSNVTFTEAEFATLPWNPRHVHSPRFTCVNPEDNILQQFLLAHKHQTMILGGMFQLAFAQLSPGPHVAGSVPLAPASGRKGPSELPHVMVLTPECLTEAIAIISGRAVSHDETQDVGELTKIYLETLEKHVPKSGDCRDLIEFIESRQLNGGQQDWEQLKSAAERDADSLENVLALRQFISLTVCMRTRVVAIPVDGGHRAALLGLISWSSQQLHFAPHLDNLWTEFRETQKTWCLTPTPIFCRLLFPTEDLTKDSVKQAMRQEGICAQNIESSGRDHNIFDWLFSVRDGMVAHEDRPVYLWQCLKPYYDRMELREFPTDPPNDPTDDEVNEHAEKLLNFLRRNIGPSEIGPMWANDNASVGRLGFHDVLEKVIIEWIQDAAGPIARAVVSETFLNMLPDSDQFPQLKEDPAKLEKTITQLFRQKEWKKKKKGGNYKDPELMPFRSLPLARFVSPNSNDFGPFSPGRYDREVPAKLLQLLYVLLWSFISPAIHEQLRGLCLPCPDKNQRKMPTPDEEGRYFDCWFTVVCIGVHTSKEVYGTGWWVKQSGNSRSLQNMGNGARTLVLLQDSIAVANEYVSDHGQDPVPPEWYDLLVTRLYQPPRPDVVRPDLVTFHVLMFVLHIHRCREAETVRLATQTPSERKQAKKPFVKSSMIKAGYTDFNGPRVSRSKTLDTCIHGLTNRSGVASPILNTSLGSTPALSWTPPVRSTPFILLSCDDSENSPEFLRDPILSIPFTTNICDFLKSADQHSGWTRENLEQMRSPLDRLMLEVYGCEPAVQVPDGAPPAANDLNETHRGAPPVEVPQRDSESDGPLPLPMISTRLAGELLLLSRLLRKTARA